MGIIGIVSALTLPNLNSSTGDKERVAKVKKIYQNLEDAFGRAEAVYGPYEDWFVGLGDDENAEKAKSKRAGERITEFMKVSKDCGMVTNKGCFSSSTYDNDDSLYKIITADGTSIGFFHKGYSFTAKIDLDGPNKGSNTPGIDIFNNSLKLDANNKYIVPYCSATGAFTSVSDCGFSWIVIVGNMDYLKADSSGKCKNNANITLDGVNNITCK